MTQPDLGNRLRHAGFLPLPLADNNGNLIGTHLWRARGPNLVECLQLYHSGLALAVRAVAGFDHGQVLDHRFGRAEDALAWLVLSPPKGEPCSAPTCS
jgi:hypothetical protein